MLYTVHLEIQGNFTSYICYPKISDPEKFPGSFVSSPPIRSSTEVVEVDANVVESRRNGKGWMDRCCLFG